jgi:hypothetical protein
VAAGRGNFRRPLLPGSRAVGHGERGVESAFVYGERVGQEGQVQTEALARLGVLLVQAGVGTRREPALGEEKRAAWAERQWSA